MSLDGLDMVVGNAAAPNQREPNLAPGNERLVPKKSVYQVSSWRGIAECITARARRLESLAGHSEHTSQSDGGAHRSKVAECI
jgi:hypothetical protein